MAEPLNPTPEERQDVALELTARVHDILAGLHLTPEQWAKVPELLEQHLDPAIESFGEAGS